MTFADIARAKVFAARTRRRTYRPIEFVIRLRQVAATDERICRVVCNSPDCYRVGTGGQQSWDSAMSREAALDLRKLIRECYEAVVVMGLPRSRSFRWLTNCAFPDPHNTLVHRQSELAAALARPPRSSFLMPALAGTRGSGRSICLMSLPILWVSADERAHLSMSGEPGDGPGHYCAEDNCRSIGRAAGVTNAAKNLRNLSNNNKTH